MSVSCVASSCTQWSGVPRSSTTSDSAGLCNFLVAPCFKSDAFEWLWKPHTFWLRLRVLQHLALWLHPLQTFDGVHLRLSEVPSTGSDRKCPLGLRRRLVRGVGRVRSLASTLSASLAHVVTSLYQMLLQVLQGTAVIEVHAPGQLRMPANPGACGSRCSSSCWHRVSET